MPKIRVSMDRPIFPAVLYNTEQLWRIGKTIGHLRAQTVKNCLELIIVAPLSGKQKNGRVCAHGARPAN